jgi:hypothetical protein
MFSNPGIQKTVIIVTQKIMIEACKIMSGKYDPEISNIFQHQEQENRNTRGHKYKF